MKMSMIGRWFGAMLAAGMLLALGAQPSYAQTTPPAGVPGTQFVFHAAGFRGAPQSDKNQPGAKGEAASYWINTPTGAVISTELRSDADDYGNTTKPLLTHANHDGTMTITWTAPLNSVVGNYALVIHGLDSNYEVALPFSVNPAGSQTVVQHDVSPAIGAAGMQFVFHATAFQGASSGNGEQASYWINTPSGAVISTELRSGTDDYGNDTKPLLAHANKDGVVTIFWTAPADAAPGSYALVVHGLTSQHEVSIPFTIQ